MMKMSRKTPRVLWTTVFWVLALIWIVPFYSSITVSFKTMSEITEGNTLGLPETWRLDNFIQAWELGIQRYILNSFIIVLASVAGVLFLSSLAGFALSRYRFPGNGLILVVYLFFNLLPPQMNLIPVYKLTQALGLYDTYLAVIIYHIAFQTGCCTFFFRNFMSGLPDELFDAARIEGAGEFTVYTQVAVPLSLPAFAALGILEFNWIWNDFIWGSILLQSNTVKPVTVGLQNLQAAYIQSWGLQNAGAVIAVIPTIVAFVVLRRYFIAGMTGGFAK